MINRFAATILIPLLIQTGSCRADVSNPSAQLPPVASFIFAGPVSLPDGDGGMTSQFKFQLAIHSIEVDHIEIIDTDTQDVLVDDTSPTLADSTLKIRTAPSIVVKQWVGSSKKEQITDSAPAWLHENGDTRVHLEARLFKSGQIVFSALQSATYSSGGKAAVLMAMKYNKTLPSQKTGVAGPAINTVADKKLQEDITKKVSETELRNGANAQVSLIAAKLLKKDDQVFEEQWTFAIDSKQAEYLVKLRKSEIGGMDFMLQKLK